METEVNGIVLTDESIETIRRFQEDGVEDHIEILEYMIDVLLCDGVPLFLNDPKVRLSHIQDLRYIEKLILTFKRPQNDGK